MNCDRLVETISLYLYGELPAPEEEEFEQHLHGCAACRGELNQHKALLRALDSRVMEPPSILLDDCRGELRRAVRTERSARRGASVWDGWWRSLLQVRRPAVALALVALGFFSARLSVRDAGRDGSLNSASLSLGEPVISTVRSVQPDASGRVEIALDETRRRLIRGNLKDGNIERLLLSAVRDEGNAGLRVESMDLLKANPGSAEVRGALIQALGNDPNPGVRMKALEGLRGMASQPPVRRALAQVLQNDQNPGLRVQAIDLLVSRRDDNLVGILQNLVQKESNNYVRLRCQSALEEMNASVGTF